MYSPDFLLSEMPSEIDRRPLDISWRNSDVKQSLNFDLESSRDSGFGSDEDDVLFEKTDIFSEGSSPIQFPHFPGHLSPETTDSSSHKEINCHGRTRRSLFSPISPNLLSANKYSNKRCRVEDVEEVQTKRPCVFGLTPEGKSDKGSSRIKSSLDQEKTNSIGDFSTEYVLPSQPGSKHKDLRGISPQTMSELVEGQFSHIVEDFIVIDCRYPYEYEGGHIKDALNIWQHQDLIRNFFSSPDIHTRARKVIIFHCEFSSERGPRMLRFLREFDRKVNQESYPFLYYPELYLLEGGYEAFYENHVQLCQPRDYKPMLQSQHLKELKYYRMKSKASRKSTKSFHQPMVSSPASKRVGPTKLTLMRL